MGEISEPPEPVASFSRLRRWDTIELLTMAAAAAIIVFFVLIPPVVGVADSGDFVRITRLFDFDNPSPEDDDRWFKYVVLEYRFDPSYHWYSSIPTSEMLLVPPALALNRLVSKSGVFDIRAIGVVHGSLFLLALGLFIPVLRNLAGWRRAAVSLATLLIFCDVLYVSQYSSFYTDTAAFLFLLLTVVFFLRVARGTAPALADRAGLFVSCILFVTAKSQHSLAGVLFAMLLAWRPGLLTSRHPALARFVGAPALAAVSLAWLAISPPEYGAGARFNVIFYRLLPGSADASADLRLLGLDDSYKRHIGNHAYTAGSRMDEPEVSRAFSARNTFGRLALFYLRHPIRTLRVVETALFDASFQRARLGNYGRSVGKPPWAQSQAFSVWSEVKRWVLNEHPWLYGFYAASLSLLLPVWLIRQGTGRRPELAEGAIVLGAATILMLLIGALADGLDYLRHLFLFNACLDVLVLAWLAALTGGRARAAAISS